MPIHAARRVGAYESVGKTGVMNVAPTTLSSFDHLVNGRHAGHEVRTLTTLFTSGDQKDGDRSHCRDGDRRDWGCDWDS